MKPTPSSAAFEGIYPKTLRSFIVANGGTITWDSADSLLFLEDSAAIYLREASLVIEDTLAMMGNDTNGGLIADSMATLVFTTDASRANYLLVNGVGAYIDGEVEIEASAEPSPGTVFDLIRLVGGGVLTGTPSLATLGYTLEINPEAGVGLRVIKN